MAFKFSFAAVAVAGIALAGAAAWWLQSRPLAPIAITGAGSSEVKPSGTGSGASRVVGVEVAKVAVQALRDDAQAVGSLRARHSVMLRPELVGRITALNFKDGGPVRKGQILVQFDDQLQLAERQQMKAQLSIAQASFKRTQELVAANFMAQQTLDTSAANVQVAQAQLALAQARLNRLSVRAPFDGTAGIRLVNVGDYVKDGADLVALEDTRQMLVDFRLPERVGSKVRPGQTVEMTLDALPASNFTAQVEAIDPLLDASGRSVGVRAVLLNSGQAGQPQALRSGMFARVTTVFSVNASALVVPEEAIVPQGDKQFVIKLVAPPEGTAMPPESKFVSQRQEVTLGVRRQGKVEIVQGLGLGDTVVVAGQQRLQKDGSPVRVVELNPEGRGGVGKADAAKSAGPAAAASAPALAASR